MKGMGRCMKGRGKMHGKGSFMKSAGKFLKSATRKKNVRKLMNTVAQIADVAGDFAVTEKGKNTAAAVERTAEKLKKRQNKSSSQEGSGRRRTYR